MNNDPTPQPDVARPGSQLVLGAEPSHLVWLTGAAVLGVVLFAAGGIVHPADMRAGFDTLWRPSLAILSIMLSTVVARNLGILDAISIRIATHAGPSPIPMFRSVFICSAVSSAVLNNDAAVLLLTPLVVGLVRHCYVGREDLTIPFAFAVFSAAGVAPLATSNPMNLIVADYIGIGFNEYAGRMIPIAIVGWIVAYGALRIVFRTTLSRTMARQVTSRQAIPALPAAARWYLGILLLSLACYPALSSIGGPVWVVAAGIAACGVALCAAYRVASPRQLVAAVSWPIAIFLYCVFVLALGLHNAGWVAHLTAFYALPPDGPARIALISAVSAVGSAILNNHPMATLNAMALRGDTHQHVLAALIGGDLGPRLLPMGSLAGLLWFDSLRRMGVRPRLGQFIGVGAALTVPALAISLAILIFVPL